MSCIIGADVTGFALKPDAFNSCSTQAHQTQY